MSDESGRPTGASSRDEGSSMEPSSDDLPAVRSPGDEIVSEFFARFGFGHPPSLVDKASSEQLDKLIEQTDQAARREDAYRERFLNRVFWLLLAALVLIGTLCWMFLYFKEVASLQQIVTLFVGLAGGGVSGFGVGRATAPKSNE